jgi:hypothetical protein
MEAKDKTGKRDIHHYKSYINRDSWLLKVQLILGLFLLAGFFMYYLLLNQ